MQTHKEVVATLNVQHNCHAGGCEVSASGRVWVEREESEDNNVTVVHANVDEYVVNSGELPGSKEVQEWMDVPRGEGEIQPLIPMLEESLAAWLQAGGIVDDDEEVELDQTFHTE